MYPPYLITPIAVSTIDVVPAAGKRFLNKSNLLKAITGLSLPSSEVRARWVIAIRSFLSRPYKRSKKQEQHRWRSHLDGTGSGDNHQSRRYGSVLTTHDSNTAHTPIMENKTADEDHNMSSDGDIIIDSKSAHDTASTSDLDQMTDESYHQSIDTTDVLVGVNDDDETAGDDSVLNLDYLLGTVSTCSMMLLALNMSMYMSVCVYV